MFPNEFSLLRCLERECRKIDDLLTVIDDTGGSATKLPNQPTNDVAVSDPYDISYFRHDRYRWSVSFKGHKNPSATQTSTDATEKYSLVAAVTGDFALHDYLQEALRESSELWKEWGRRHSFDIVKGIKARIEALLYIKEQVPNPGDTVHPSIKGK